MSRVFITGDKHGDFSSDNDYSKIKAFCERFETTTDDYMIVLGDHGIHYDDGWQDHRARKKLAKFPITFIMIRGNHDMRPSESWEDTFAFRDESCWGRFYVDPEVSNILYTREYAWYRFAGNMCYVIGGAYSVDKYYRLEQQAMGHRNWRWFANEQLDDRERQCAGEGLFRYLDDELFNPTKPYYILSHTCPKIFTTEINLLPQIDQESVDNSMELWMNDLYAEMLRKDRLPAKWFCGHYHTDMNFDIARFMYHDIVELEQPTLEGYHELR